MAEGFFGVALLTGAFSGAGGFSLSAEDATRGTADSIIESSRSGAGNTAASGAAEGTVTAGSLTAGVSGAMGVFSGEVTAEGAGL